MMVRKTASDNSKNNKDHAQTADNQSNVKADRQTTASIRKAILADKDLSTYAHNIKIITLNGAVTLSCLALFQAVFVILSRSRLLKFIAPFGCT